MIAERASAGDAIQSNCRIIEVHVGELKQLFNAIDPSPFRDKDLDPRAEEFIVGWSKDLPADAQLALMVYLDRPAGLRDEPSLLKDAVHEFFSQRAHCVAPAITGIVPDWSNQSTHRDGLPDGVGRRRQLCRESASRH